MSQVTSSDIFKGIENNPGYKAYKSFFIPIKKDETEKSIEVVLVELNPGTTPKFTSQDTKLISEYLAKENIIDLAQRIEEYKDSQTEVALVIPTNEKAYPPDIGTGIGFGVDYDFHRKLIELDKEKDFNLLREHIESAFKEKKEGEKVVALSLTSEPKADFGITHHTVWAVGPSPATDKKELATAETLIKGAETKSLYGKIFQEVIDKGVTDLIIPAIAGGNFLLKEKAIPVLFDGLKDFFYGKKYGNIERIYLPFLGNDHSNAFEKRYIYTLNAMTILGA